MAHYNRPLVHVCNTFFITHSSVGLSGSGDQRIHSGDEGSSSRLLGNGTTSKSVSNGTTKTMEKPSSSSSSKLKGGDQDSTRSVMMLIVIFLTSAVALGYVYFMFPKLDESERQHVKMPFNIEDAKQLAKVLDRYKDLYYIEVMGGIVLAYIL